jgi:hypothetical protein
MSWREKSNPSTGWTPGSEPPVNWLPRNLLNFLLCEDGTYLLQEDRHKIIIEGAINTLFTNLMEKGTDWTEKLIPDTNWTNE